MSSVSESLVIEYHSAVKCYAAHLRRAARDAGDFLGDHASYAIAEREFRAELEKGFVNWLGLVAYWQTIS